MKNKQTNELAVCGFESVKALAEQHSEKISRFFFSKEHATVFGTLCKALAAQRVLYRMIEDESELEKLCQSVHHQGVVAMIEQPQAIFVTPLILQRWIEKRTTVLILDRVGNANNLGAIIRSAAFFGIRDIVLSADDAQAQITTSAYRIAQGGMEFTTLYTVLSIEHLLKSSAHTMLSIAADHHAEHSLSTYPTRVTELDPTQEKGIFVILGNEESGLSPAILHASTTRLRIAGSGHIESLNVAQAANLFLYEMSRPV